MYYEVITRKSMINVQPSMSCPNVYGKKLRRRGDLPIVQCKLFHYPTCISYYSKTFFCQIILDIPYSSNSHHFEKLYPGWLQQKTVEKSLRSQSSTYLAEKSVDGWM